jgi:hypothetical protein
MPPASLCWTAKDKSLAIQQANIWPRFEQQRRDDGVWHCGRFDAGWHWCYSSSGACGRKPGNNQLICCRTVRKVMDFLKTAVDLFLHLDEYLSVAIQNYGIWTYGLLFVVIFIETGLVITPFSAG